MEAEEEVRDLVKCTFPAEWSQERLYAALKETKKRVLFIWHAGQTAVVMFIEKVDIDALRRHVTTAEHVAEGALISRLSRAKNPDLYPTGLLNEAPPIQVLVSGFTNIHTIGQAYSYLTDGCHVPSCDMPYAIGLSDMGGEGKEIKIEMAFARPLGAAHVLAWLRRSPVNCDGASFGIRSIHAWSYAGKARIDALVADKEAERDRLARSLPTPPARTSTRLADERAAALPYAPSASPFARVRQIRAAPVCDAIGRWLEKKHLADPEGEARCLAWTIPMDEVGTVAPAEVPVINEQLAAEGFRLTGMHIANRTLSVGIDGETPQSKK